MARQVTGSLGRRTGDAPPGEQMKSVVGRVTLAVVLVGSTVAAVNASTLSPQGQVVPEVVRPAAGPTSSAPSARAPESSAPVKTVRVRPVAIPKNVTPFSAQVSYPDGVRVAVTQIKRVELKKRLTVPKVKKGAPVQVLTVKLTNNSAKPVRVAVTSAMMTYGQGAKVAPAIHDKSTTSIVGAVQPGRSRAGTYAFSVPKKYLHQAKLSFSFDDVHAPARFAGSLDYSPGNGVVFNDPTGSTAEQLAIVRSIGRAIDATPKGETIQIAQYSLDIASSADKLLKAHKRGVRVQLIVDQHRNIVTTETRRLIKALGENRKKKSFLVRCGASCMSNRTSAMHAKFFLFSAVGSSQHVSMVGSANLTHTNTRDSWNDTQTVVGDKVLYDSLREYFRDMTPDKKQLNYYRTTTSGDHKAYFFPQKTGKKPVVLLGVLKQVSCKGAAPGYGDKKRRTIVRVGMYSWTSTRLDIARQLYKLHNAGCLVQVIYNSGRTSSYISHELLRRSSKYGQMQLYDAWVDRNVNNKPERYMHLKVLMINGVLGEQKNTKVVYGGSQNFTPNATTDNNDLIFRTADDAVYSAYAENFVSIREKTQRLRWFVRGFQRDPFPVRQF
ncbi:MAG TPA: phospholipase D-like domain-containing protein [Propionibacteriaceae bacterium]